MHIDETLTLTDLAQGGVVKACASVFPVQMWYQVDHSDGTTDANKLSHRTRLIIAQHPTMQHPEGGAQWVAIAYSMPSTGGEPQMVHFAEIDNFDQLDARNISYTVVYENGDITQYRAHPDGGCSCGMRMKQWQPFADHGAQLAAVTRPDIG